jgi:hypothetical protein
LIVTDQQKIKLPIRAAECMGYGQRGAGKDDEVIMR